MYSLTGKNPLICREICEFPDLAGVFTPISMPQNQHLPLTEPIYKVLS
jgi:hypothetical protein